MLHFWKKNGTGLLKLHLTWWCYNHCKQIIKETQIIKRHWPVSKWEELGLATLKERRHQGDMVLTYKILTGKDMVNSETWFTSETESGRPTRSAADTLNLRPQASRLEIRRQFFSQRVAESWNKIPASLKQAKIVKCFSKCLQNSPWHNGGKHLIERRLRRLENRKVVWTTTIAWQSLSVPTGAMETQPSSIQVSKREDPPVPVPAVAVVPTPAIVPTEAVAATAPII